MVGRLLRHRRCLPPPNESDALDSTNRVGFCQAVALGRVFQNGVACDLLATATPPAKSSAQLTLVRAGKASFGPARLQS
jgi:hypothetical protein